MIRALHWVVTGGSAAHVDLAARLNVTGSKHAASPSQVLRLPERIELGKGVRKPCSGDPGRRLVAISSSARREQEVLSTTAGESSSAVEGVGEAASLLSAFAEVGLGVGWS